MTLNVNDVRDEYTATASQTIFNYTFKIYASTDLDVYATLAGQACSDGDLTTAYTVTGVGAEAGGTIVFSTARSVNDLITIVSSIPSSRTTDYQNNGDFRPDTVNDDFDRTVSLVKQAIDKSSRALTFQNCLQGVNQSTLPTPENGRIMQWNAAETGLENTDKSTSVIQIGGAFVFENVAAMVASTVLIVGQLVRTLGYTTVGDGGGNDYQVVAVSTGTDDGGSFIDLASLQAKGLFGNEVNVKQFGAVADGDLSELSPYASKDNAPEFKAAIDYVLGLGEGKVYVPAGIYRTFTDSNTKTLTIFGTNLNFEFYGDGPFASIIINSRGGTSSPGTVLCVGKSNDVHGVTAATLGELDTLDFSNINTSEVTVHDIGVAMPPDTYAAGNQGVWVTNSREINVYNIGGYGCSNTLSIGNDADESCSNVTFSNIQQVASGRWYTIFIGASQHIVGQNVIAAEGRASDLAAIAIIRGRFLSIDGITIDGRESSTFGGNATGISINTSEHCAIDNVQINNITGDGVALFQKLVLPSGASATGPTWHTVGKCTFKNTHNCVTIFTEANVVGPIIADTATISQGNPSATLTLSTAAIASGVTCTADSSIFISGDVGKRITLGGGIAKITGFTSGTVVTIENVRAFSGTSLATGTWTLINNALVHFKTNGDNNTVYGNQDQLSPAFMREDATIRDNKVMYGMMDIKDIMHVGPSLYGHTAPGNTTAIQWQINAVFGTSMELKAPNGIVRMESTNSIRVQLDGTGSSEAFYPDQSNTIDLGKAGKLWEEVWSAIGTINTSDARAKNILGPVPDDILDVWETVEYKSFTWKEKPDKGIFFGVIAQDIIEKFKDAGFNPFDYGLVRYDEWEEDLNEDGTINTEAGNRFSVRYDQCAVLDAALTRRTLKELKGKK